jgi:predicted RNase H-like HicB family nuclease
MNDARLEELSRVASWTHGLTLEEVREMAQELQQLRANIIVSSHGRPRLSILFDRGSLATSEGGKKEEGGVSVPGEIDVGRRGHGISRRPQVVERSPHHCKS